MEVEVGLKGKAVLGIFQLVLKGDLLLEGSHKFALIIRLQRGVSSGGTQ